MTQTAAVGAQKSTIVRTTKAPLPMRAAFSALERIAPAPAARWAEHLWFTLPRAAPRGAPHPGGRPFLTSVEGHTVAGETWGDGLPVYLVHGWGGHRAQFAALIEPLVAHGFMAVAFDMPSHGDSGPGASGPRSATFPEFTATLQQVVGQYGRPHAIVAHSAGAIATAAALCDGMPADRVVFLSPMASALSQLRQFVAALGVGPRTFERLTARVERRVGAPMRHFDVPELGRAVAMPPTLVIHDRGDRSTSVTDGAAIAAAWRDARLQVTSGLGHNRLLRSPDVIGQVVDFVAS